LLSRALVFAALWSAVVVGLTNSLAELHWPSHQPCNDVITRVVSASCIAAPPTGEAWTFYAAAVAVWAAGLTTGCLVLWRVQPRGT
jgi:hypothetical protein